METPPKGQFHTYNMKLQPFTWVLNDRVLKGACAPMITITLMEEGMQLEYALCKHRHNVETRDVFYITSRQHCVPFYTREVESLKKGAFSLMRSFVRMLVHSSPLYNQAFNLKSSIVQHALLCVGDTFMELACGTTTATNSQSFLTTSWSKS